MAGAGRRLLGGLAILAAAGCAPKVLPPGPPSAAPSLDTQRFVAADGAELPVRVWLPAEGAPRAVLVALHGFNDYGNFFAAPGDFLAAAGIAAYAYDQRGFGAAPNRGLWPGIAAYAADLGAVAEAVRARHPGVPLYLLGESMGGAVIMVALTSKHPPPADGAILAAPAVWGRTTMPWYQRAALWVGAHTVPWLKVSGRGLRIRASDNDDMLLALGRDPLVIKETRIDTLYGVANLMDAALASASRLDGRLLILYGRHDEVVPDRPTRIMLSRLPAEGAARRRVALYDEGYHMLLRDLQAETVWRDIAAWIADPDAPLPSEADRSAAPYPLLKFRLEQGE